MGIKWNSRLKIGIAILVIGIALACCTSDIFPTYLAPTGHNLIKLGMVFTFWGAFFTMRDWKYNKEL